MDAILRKFIKRRGERIKERGIVPEIVPNMDNPQLITAYQKKRDVRLKKRGVEFKGNRYHADAPEDDGDNNNQEKSSGGGGAHGNTRLPFGLCKRFGIEIGEGWTPRDAWDALAGKGITPDVVYGKLKAGDKAGNFSEEELSKLEEGALAGEAERAFEQEAFEEIEASFPRKTLSFAGTGTYGDGEYEKLDTYKRTWEWRGHAPYTLTGERVEGSGDPDWAKSRYRTSLAMYFSTKMDLFGYLKDNGVDEIKDPDTGEIVDLRDIEVEKPLIVIGSERYGSGREGILKLSAGYRKDRSGDGKYVIIGENYDGKKRTLDDFESIRALEDWVKSYGITMDDVKLSPALKKREKERLSWLSSDKKEYLVSDVSGDKYGDLHLIQDWAGWYIHGEAEDGRGKTFMRDGAYRWGTKAEMMQWLKEQGVEKVYLDKEIVNPQEFIVPKATVTIRDIPYQKVELLTGGYDNDLYLYGVDLDGQRKKLKEKGYDESVDDFMSRINAEFGLSEGDMYVSDEEKEKIQRMRERDAEKARRKAEFEEKAVSFRDAYGDSRKFIDPTLIKSPYSDEEYRLIGYDREGRERRILGIEGDFYDVKRMLKDAGYEDIDQFIKRDEIREAYDKYKEKISGWEKRAVAIFGYGKLADIEIGYDPLRGLTLSGTDERGRTDTVLENRNFSTFLTDLEYMTELDIDSIPMSEEAKEKLERGRRVRDALDSGGYYGLGVPDTAVKDITIRKAGRGWMISGVDVDGDVKDVIKADSWDEAIEEMDKYKVQDYSFTDPDTGEVYSKPVNGMHSVRIMKRPDGTAYVTAKTGGGASDGPVYEAKSVEEAKKWLKDNHVPDEAIRVRGANPNDDVVRTHGAVSLAGFDDHRKKKIEEYEFVNDMPEDMKVKSAELLTDMFDKGAYRMNRQDHFEEIVENGFKNLLETGTSGGSSYKPGRRETGVKTFGHDYDIDPEDAEKYGYWGFEDDKENMADSTAHWYGKIDFKFKKDRVGERTTYTFGDSLDCGRPLAGYAGAKPTIEGLTALGSWSGKEKINNILDAYDEYKKGDKTFADLKEAVQDECSYVECQYHGNLGIEDVDSVTFRKRDFDKTFEHMSPEKRKSILTKLQTSGVKLQYYDNDNEEIRDGYERLKKKYGEG